MEFSKKTSWAFALAVPLLIGLAGAAAIAWATARSVGASGDSVRYIEHARVLAGEASPVVNGQYAVSLSHYPPLYPLMLAIGIEAGAAPLAAARAINIACYVLLITLSGAIVYGLSQSGVRSAIAAALVATSPAVVPIHLWAASEPPFLVCVMLMLASLLWWWRTPAIRRTALSAGVLGMATIIRYAAVAYIPATVLLALMRSGPWKQRLTRALIFGAIAIASFLIVAAGHRIAGAQAGNRQFAYVPIAVEQWKSLGQTICEWFAPAGTSPWLVVPAIAVWATLLATQWRGARAGAAVLVLCATYLAFILFSVSFMDSATPLDHRILAPVALFLIIWSTVDIGREGSNKTRAAAAIAGIAIALSAAAGGSITAGKMLRDSRDSGLGLAHRVFRESELLVRVRHLPPEALIYATYPEAVQLHSNRRAEILPARQTRPNPRLPPIDQLVAQMRERLDRRGGYLVVFHARAGRNRTTRPLRVEQWRELFNLNTVIETTDGVILRYDPPPTRGSPATTQTLSFR